MKEITLVKGKDGVYSEPNTNVGKKKKADKKVEEFFEGMDKGLDFLEGLESRLSRIFKNIK